MKISALNVAVTGISPSNRGILHSHRRYHGQDILPSTGITVSQRLQSLSQGQVTAGSIQAIIRLRFKGFRAQLQTSNGFERPADLTQWLKAGRIGLFTDRINKPPMASNGLEWPAGFTSWHKRWQLKSSATTTRAHTQASEHSKALTVSRRVMSIWTQTNNAATFACR